MTTMATRATMKKTRMTTRTTWTLARTRRQREALQQACGLAPDETVLLMTPPLHPY